MDRAGAQTDAHRHQLLSSESQHRRRDGIHLERYLQLHLHVEQPLAVRHTLLQDLPVYRGPYYLRQRLHSDGDIYRSVSIERNRSRVRVCFRFSMKKREFSRKFRIKIFLLKMNNT